MWLSNSRNWKYSKLIYNQTMNLLQMFFPILWNVYPDFNLAILKRHALWNNNNINNSKLLKRHALWNNNNINNNKLLMLCVLYQVSFNRAKSACGLIIIIIIILTSCLGYRIRPRCSLMRVIKGDLKGGLLGRAKLLQNRWKYSRTSSSSNIKHL